MNISITYPTLLLVITLVWIVIRAAVWKKDRCLDLRRECALLTVYICIIVVVRFTFFPFSKIDGQIAPLIFDSETMLPPRINLKPFIYLFDYPSRREALLNLVGNTAMFLPLGIVWPAVFRSLRTPAKVILSGFGTSLCIEILQLPFHDRVTDIDDLILNTLGFLCGYAVYLAVRAVRQTYKKKEILK